MVVDDAAMFIQLPSYTKEVSLMKRIVSHLIIPQLLDTKRQKRQTRSNPVSTEYYYSGHQQQAYCELAPFF
jgi:hypothetical protein